MSSPSRGAASPPPRLPSAIWVLGFVSLLMDVSSEMIHSVLPLFLVGPLGVSVLKVGVIEGVAESAALVAKVFSGGLSDRLGRRKRLVVIGYALSAASKPFFALAQGAGVVIAARFVDRIGKGFRGAPRDALVADLAPSSLRGAAYGLRQALDSVGAIAGPLLAAGLMLAFVNDFRLVFWIAVVPRVLAVLLLALGVNEPDRAAPAGAVEPIRRQALQRLGPACWRVVGLGALFTLARYSEAFLVLRAETLGVPTAWVPLVMVAMNVVYAASAYPFGKLADAMDRARLLGLGLLVLIAADVVLATASGWPALLAGVAPEDLRGTAFGAFNLVAGLALLAASAVAGSLWQWLGAPATFAAGAASAALTLAALPFARRGSGVGQL